ncbi:hypothetical protein EVAR_55419_1 [Eumeta japonica]|uniref:Uncharacterized protein n=1 Tax=Eumeta variegata TaxID=151549 RepID=A0A4C1Z4T2_EUMVA|nr:hypothetical protein EVAR_55419_1 [Eumeta japonica]
MRHECQFPIYNQTEEGYFANQVDLLAIHMHHRVVVFQLFGEHYRISFRWREAQLISDSPAVHARARLDSSSIDKADCLKNMRTTSSMNACTFSELTLSPKSGSRRLDKLYNPVYNAWKYPFWIHLQRIVLFLYGLESNLAPCRRNSLGNYKQVARFQRRPSCGFEGALYVQ